MTKEWCERGDVIGYQLAKGKDAVDCALANTGSDLTPYVLLGLALVALGLFCLIVGHRGDAA